MLKNSHIRIPILFLFLNVNLLYLNAQVWNPNFSENEFINPIIFADYSDPDVIRVGDDFYLISSSFSNYPGLPVLHSTDLVNWEIIGHAAINYPFKEFEKPRHGNGIWAPSLRFHNGKYWILFGDPDHGILLTTAENPAGPWSELKLIIEGKGLIDPCPLWDDNGKTYIVHAWAKSRAGFNSILTVREMSPELEKIIGNRVDVYNGLPDNKTIEGPKFYKRKGYYYIFAPAGGVKTGWQTVLRSRNVYGPYEVKKVLEQGSTNINGPHQGGLVELESGESWFIHFQDKNAYGRVVLLNPVKWFDGWPKMGVDFDGNGIGEPVAQSAKPNIKISSTENLFPQTSDEFNNDKLGLQWQWEALPKSEYYNLGNEKLRLNCIPEESNSLRDMPNLIGQKFSAEEFSAEIKLNANLEEGAEAGIVILGEDYSSLKIKKINSELILIQSIYTDKNKKENKVFELSAANDEMLFKIKVEKNAVCKFYYSYDGENFTLTNTIFNAVPGKWIGAKICLFANSTKADNSYAEFDYIRFTMN